MQSNHRDDLREVLQRYITDTLPCVETVRRFCESSSDWLQRRTQEQETLKVLGQKFQESKDENSADLEELSEILSTTRTGLDQLRPFVDSVEKLSVTSRQVFHTSVLPEGGASELQAFITVAEMVCPQLIIFKQDFSVLFGPSPYIIHVQVSLLDQYVEVIRIVTETCSQLLTPQSSTSFSWDPVIHKDLTQKQVQKMLSQILALKDLRTNAAFRMQVYFQGDSGSTFVTEFRTRHVPMQQMLEVMEDASKELDKMKKGEKISSVVGSVVGLGGGVLSIVGLALAPVTGGLSALLITGVTLGVTAGANGMATSAARYFVNRKQKKRAEQAIERFKEDMTMMQMSLEKGTTLRKVDLKAPHGLLKTVGNSGGALARILLEVPEAGQAAAETAAAISRGLRGGLIAVNGIFMALDLVYIVKDSIYLAKGCETKDSKMLRATVALFQSEIDMWQSLCEALEESTPKAEEHKALLQKMFYPKVPDFTAQSTTPAEERPLQEGATHCEQPTKTKGMSCSVM